MRPSQNLSQSLQLLRRCQRQHFVAGLQHGISVGQNQMTAPDDGDDHALLWQIEIGDGRPTTDESAAIFSTSE